MYYLIMAPKSNRSCLTTLPAEILLKIFESVTFKDLISLSLVNHHFREVVKDESLWKVQCEQCFLHTQCPEEGTWRELFESYYKQFGDVLHYYRQIRIAWNKILQYLAKFDAILSSSLKPGATEEELKEEESIMGCRFPDDLRCSLKMVNGQKQGPGPGLLGCIAISNHFRSEKLLDYRTIANNYMGIESLQLRGCTPITNCCMTHHCQIMSFHNEYGIPKGQIIFPCADEKYGLDAFICGKNFTEWLEELADLMDREIFYRIKGCHFRFLHVAECVAVTNNMFTCTVGTCFMPDLSTIHPPNFFHVYRITLKMDEKAPRTESCELVSRYWSITDMDGNEEVVEGPGVVGEFPRLTPGEEFSWESGTSFPTSYGNMKGHFVMKNLISGAEFNIECPMFHMKCLPYETSDQWKERALEYKKNL